MMEDAIPGERPGYVPHDVAPSKSSLRERKKAKARALIQAEALRLFNLRGYEATTVAQIAEAAEVSPSTLFRYFPTKADILRYDMLDPILFAAYREQPAELRPIAALREAGHAMLVALPPQVLGEQWQRARLILSIPELRASVLDDSRRVEEQFAEAERARTGRQPDRFNLHILVGALTGALTAVLQSGPEDAGDNYAAALDRAFELLEEGLPL